ncbi:hypothetical protein H7H78_10470 [Mycobacterium shinjukuense]|nr:hypothetical protein [Mycobacterium shinjukuense]MCV6985839.1 hypothetical protein [Mycobacterium shinjukuense]ORB71842.1 hypothetical protein BST45_01885 [Mycobacterium shinjukuense]
MAPTNQPDDTHPGTASPSVPDGSEGPRVIRLRIAPWDVVCTVAILGVLLVMVAMTSWPSRLFAFTESVCPPDSCQPVPFGVNYYIYPVMWGGIGAAVAAAVIGPFVSMVRGWYMSFWPIIAIGVITLTSVAGYAMTGFSERYWH